MTVTDGTNSYTNCLIIAPDDFTGTIAETYTLDDLETAGLVCLPAAGTFFGSNFEDAGNDGRYWSSTPCENHAGDARYLYFKSSNAYDYDFYRKYGNSLRAVLAE